MTPDKSLTTKSTRSWQLSMKLEDGSKHPLQVAGEESNI
jgi:hypothetical protein